MNFIVSSSRLVHDYLSDRSKFVMESCKSCSFIILESETVSPGPRDNVGTLIMCSLSMLSVALIK